MPKNNRTKRYQKTEDKLYCALRDFFRENGDTVTINTAAFCRKYGILEHTLYDHGTLDDLLRQMETTIRADIKNIVKHGEDQDDLSLVFFLVLLSVRKRRVFFDICEARHSSVLWEAAISELRPRLTRLWESNGAAADAAIFSICGAEITVVLRAWLMDGCPKEAEEEYVARLVRLTSYASKRLAGA